MSSQPKPEEHVRNGYEISPTMARHLVEAKAGDGSTNGDLGRLGRFASSTSLNSGGGQRRRDQGGAAGSAARRGRPSAAGAYDPSSSRGPMEERYARQSTQKQGFVSRLFGGGSSSSNKSGSSSALVSSSGTRAGPSTALASPTTSNGPSSNSGQQRLLGAEGLIRSQPPARIGAQMDWFTDLYSRLLVFKRHRREIIFATVPVLDLLGLPTGNAKQVYKSPLLHADVLDLMRGENRGETRQLREAVKEAVKSGDQISVKTGLRVQKKGLMGRMLGGATGSGDGGAATMLEGSEEMRVVTMHITPLVDRENSSFAFVAVLG